PYTSSLPCDLAPLSPSLALPLSSSFFLSNDTATTHIYTLSLHDALPISPRRRGRRKKNPRPHHPCRSRFSKACGLDCSCSVADRSEEHTSELQSPYDLVCRLLLEKKKRKTINEQTIEVNRYTK